MFSLFRWFMALASKIYLREAKRLVVCVLSLVCGGEKGLQWISHYFSCKGVITEHCKGVTVDFVL